ncbi:MAG: alcohol dehydrogenase catalytic domain-containing protein [Sporichthyaceae bacterium]
MRAVVWTGPDRVEVADVPEPSLLADTDAIVAVRLAGVCGTDLHVASGHAPGMRPGTQLGHEFVGTVVAAGAGVRRAVVGTEVMGSDYTACGACWWCDRGEHWHCTQRQFFGTGGVFGPELAGAQAELVRVPFADTVLAPLPPGIDEAAALLVGDNLATGWVSCERGGLRPGDVLAVVGGGPVGQLTALCAQTMGAAAVVIADPVAERRDLAKSQGSLGVAPEELAAVCRELTDGRGADVVVEAVGQPFGLEAALAAVRTRGTVVSAGAHTEPSWAMPLAATFANELTLSFVIGDPMRARRALLPLLAAGVLDPTFVISGIVDHEDAVDAYARLRDRSAMKLLLDLR